MKGKLLLKSTLGTPRDGTKFLAFTDDQLQKITSSQEWLPEINEFIFESIEESQHMSVMRVLIVLGKNYPAKSIQFKNCKFTENLSSQLADMLLSGKHQIKSFISSDRTQNINLINVLVRKLTAKITQLNPVSIGGLSISISSPASSNSYGSYNKPKLQCSIKLSDFSSWRLYKDELSPLIELQKSFEKVCFSFGALSVIEESELVNWLNDIVTDASFDVTVDNKKRIEEKCKKLNERNSRCRWSKDDNSFSFHGRLGKGAGNETAYLLDDADVKCLIKLFSRIAEIQSVSFGYCDTEPKNWEAILRAVNQLKNLFSISFSEIKIDSKSAKIFANEISKCTMLKKFSLENIPRGEFLAIIKSLYKIEPLSEVVLGCEDFAIGDIRAVAMIPGLRVLKFAGSRIPEVAFKEFESFFEHDKIELIQFNDIGDIVSKAKTLLQMVSKSSSFPSCAFRLDSDSPESYELSAIQDKMNTIKMRNQLMQKLKKADEIIAQLNFRSLLFGDECVSVVCDYIQAHIEVKKLNIFGNVLTVNGFKRLAKGLSESSLTQIDLSYSQNAPPVESIAELLNKLKKLEIMDLLDVKVDYKNLFSTLVQSASFPCARVVFSYENRFDNRDEGTGQLLIFQEQFDRLQTRNKKILDLVREDNDSNFEHLSELNFDNYYLSDICLPILKRYIESHAEVIKFSAVNNAFTAEGVRSLCDILANAAHVACVNLSGTQGSNFWLGDLVESYIKYSHLTELVIYDATDNKDEILRCISESKLKKLELAPIDGLFEAFRDSQNLFTTEIITSNPEETVEFVRVRKRNIMLSQFLNLQRTDQTEINLSEAAITPPLVSIVCEALLKNPQLRVLSLAGNSLEDKSMALLLNAIASHPNIRTINISNNTIGDASILVLKQYLIKTNILHELQCKNNDISDKAVIHLSNALGMNHSLTTINLSNNAHVLSNLEMFGKELRKNKTLLEFICLDDSNKFDSYSEAKNKYECTPGTKQMRALKAQLKDKKISLEKEIDQKREFTREFINALTCGPKKTVNNTLVNCSIYHPQLFSPMFDFRVKKQGESDCEIPIFVSRNQRRATECHVTLENILRTADEKEFDKFTDFLDEGVSVYYSHSQNRTFLHMAVSSGHLRLAGIILNKISKFDIDIRDQEGKSPLDLAKGNEELEKLLRDGKKSGMPNDIAATQPANKKAKTIPAAEATAPYPQAEEELFLSETLAGASPLEKKAKAGSDFAADDEISMKMDDWMVVQAIHSENIMGLKSCINQNLGLLSSNINGQTLLHIAVECKKPRVVAMLVSSGANVNVTNQNERPALFCLLDECLDSTV